MEDGDDAGSHLPAVDDLSNDETEGSGSSEESDVFDVRRREDEPWSETASSSERTSCSVDVKRRSRASLTSSTESTAWWANL